MPRLSCWLIRASLVYLALGFTFGGLMLFQKGVPLDPALWQLLPAHLEFVLIGWTVQLAMGVGFWVWPRFGSARPHEGAAWLAFALLNAGVWLAGMGQTLGASGAILVLGRVAEAGAALAFVAHAWPRVKPTGA